MNRSQVVTLRVFYADPGDVLPPAQWTWEKILADAQPTYVPSRSIPLSGVEVIAAGPVVDYPRPGARCPECGEPSLNGEVGNDCGRDACASAIAGRES